MRKVYKITESYAKILKGLTYDGEQGFNPRQDAGDTPLDEEGYHILDENGNPTGQNRNWFIGLEEVDCCKPNPQYDDWIHTLEIIDYNPIKLKTAI